MFTMFSDTDSEMTPALGAELGFKLISMPFSIDGTEFFPYESYDSFDDHEFYEKLRHGTLPKTSGISIEKYIQYFEPEFAAGRDILYVHFSPGVSNTFAAMAQAEAQLKEKYPERTLYKINTKAISVQALAIDMEISKLYKAGKTIEEIMAWAEVEVPKYALYLMAEDLKFFHHSGRVSGLSAAVGTVLGIRPIINLDDNGKMQSIGKEKGRRKTIARLVQYMQETGDDVKNHPVILGHCDAMELAEETLEALREAFGEDLKVTVVPVNPTIGAHAGPSAMGIAFHATHR